MIEPATLECGHSLCLLCLVKIDKCPFCRKTVLTREMKVDTAYQEKVKEVLGAKYTEEKKKFKEEGMLVSKSIVVMRMMKDCVKKDAHQLYPE